MEVGAAAVEADAAAPGRLAEPLGAKQEMAVAVGARHAPGPHAPVQRGEKAFELRLLAPVGHRQGAAAHFQVAPLFELGGRRRVRPDDAETVAQEYERSLVESQPIER